MWAFIRHTRAVVAAPGDLPAWRSAVPGVKGRMSAVGARAAGGFTKPVGRWRKSPTIGGEKGLLQTCVMSCNQQ